MRTIIAFLLGTVMIGCQAPDQSMDNSAQKIFEKNSATVSAYLEDWQNEKTDYSIFADDFIQARTSYGASDSLTLEQKKEQDAKSWEIYDYNIVNDPIILLPGVNADTKQMDGSVRYYVQWELIKSATDSTEAKSGTIKSYTSFDFDEEGKILFVQFYGDIGGLMTHLNSME